MFDSIRSGWDELNRNASESTDALSTLAGRTLYRTVVGCNSHLKGQVNEGGIVHTQLLNLPALLGTQPAEVSSIRAIWAVPDTIALNTEEDTANGLKRQAMNGKERAV